MYRIIFLLIKSKSDAVDRIFFDIYKIVSKIAVSITHFSFDNALFEQEHVDGNIAIDL